MSNDVAPEGMLFVCMACGKKSTTRYGFTGNDPGPYKSTADPGWDESCMMNASLVTKEAYEEWRSRPRDPAKRERSELPEGGEHD